MARSLTHMQQRLCSAWQPLARKYTSFQTAHGGQPAQLGSWSEWAFSQAGLQVGVCEQQLKATSIDAGLSRTQSSPAHLLNFWLCCLPRGLPHTHRCHHLWGIDPQVPLHQTHPLVAGAGPQVHTHDVVQQGKHIPGGPGAGGEGGSGGGEECGVVAERVDYLVLLAAVRCVVRGSRRSVYCACSAFSSAHWLHTVDTRCATSCAPSSACTACCLTSSTPACH